ncbi:MAG: 2,3-bisphosphoglycerate-independent phosphoglycerate mutase [Aestuariivita sp.]|nr:2,3-bisphosphoglycerate-independent phosphoglycerate mutase [Aestuariivita sp.]
MNSQRPVVLCILDGWGLSDNSIANAPLLAQTPNFDTLKKTVPFGRIKTHGSAVGLPDDQMGNSEVGHSTIGAGRVEKTNFVRINLAIKEGYFGRIAELREFIHTLRKTNGIAHLIGIISDGGVHGHLRHMVAAVKEISTAGVSVLLHAISDGRDVAPKSALTFVRQLEAELPNNIQIATLTGRYFAMDRDNRWDRVRKAYNAIVRGVGRSAADVSSAVELAYERQETDEFIEATVLNGYSGICDGDGVFCLNFRADRVRQLMSAIADPEFSHFGVVSRPKLASCLGMVDYSNQHSNYIRTVFKADEAVNYLGSWIGKHELRQFRLAETEKYPHVTFFFNGGKECPELNEDRFMVKSPNVATYDLTPEMSAPEVTKRLVFAIQQNYDFIVVNFANPDMVGHTGDLQAAISACEEVDRSLGEAIKAVTSVGGIMIVTADHGNCEMMVNGQTGGPHTAHTLNLVPVFLVGCASNVRLRDGQLSDIAPTILELLGLTAPLEMTGNSLLNWS